jgi:hypothetical protein
MQNINFPLKVQLAGDSIWDYDGPQTVTVSGIDLYYVDEDYNTVPADAPNARLLDVHVKHDTDWRIYTDSGFEAAISAALGFDVAFTEQGMQDNGLASMEEV